MNWSTLSPSQSLQSNAKTSARKYWAKHGTLHLQKYAQVSPRLSPPDFVAHEERRQFLM